MKNIRQAGVLFSLVFCLCIPPAMASNGLVLIGYGAKARGMAGASLAMTEDSLVTAINPASVAHVETRGDAGLLIFHPERRAACCLAPGGQISDKELFFIPNMAAVFDFGDKIALGFGFVGYGGGRTQYPQNIFTVGGTKLGVELSIAVMSPTVAYRFSDDESVGVSLLIGIQRFRALGLEAFKQFATDTELVTNNGYDWSYGAGLRFGWYKNINKDLSVAAVAQTETNMTKFDKYQGLFPEGGNFDLPAALSLGLAYKLTDKVTVAFDWQRMFYEGVRAIGNRTLPISAVLGSPENMGRDTGPGFGWENQDVFKLGAQYEYSPKWTLRAGVNYGESPIIDETGGGEFEVNVLAPAVTELHLTFGGTYALSKRAELTVAYMHAFNNKEQQNLLGSDLPYTNQIIELEMQQNAIDVGFGYKF